MKFGCAAYYCAVKYPKESGWQPRADVMLTYVVGELQGGIGTSALIKEKKISGDYSVNCEPSDIRAITLPSEAHKFEILLTGITRHMSAREEAQDAIMAACQLIPQLNGMTFRGAKTPAHEKVNGCSVGKYNTRPDEKVDIPDYIDCSEMFMRLIVDIRG
jgi:acetylornithine deacetylase